MSTLSMKEQSQEYPKSLACTDCKQAGSRQTLAALSVRDWQGTLLCICRHCYNQRSWSSPKFAGSSASSGDGASSKHGQALQDFDSFHKSSWRARKTNAKGAGRVKDWQKAQQQLSVRGDNESRRKYRQRVIARALILAAVCSIRRLYPSQRKEVEAALDWWAEEQKEIAREPSHIPSLTAPSAVLPDVAVQYLASITDTLSEYFLCRQYDMHVLCLVASARSLGTIFFSIRGCGERETALSVAVAPCLIRWLHLRKRRPAATFPPRTIGFTRT